MDKRDTRFDKALSNSFSNESVFTNINEIKKLGNEIHLLDVINPSSSTYNKIAELLSRIKSLREFELITDGEQLFKNRHN